MASKIEWTDETWNPVVGCSFRSPGCTNCYAMRMAGRLEIMGVDAYRGTTIKTKAGSVWSGNVVPAGEVALLRPLGWSKSRKIFVNSMSDLFHELLPLDVIDKIYAVMALADWHTYQVLTKREARQFAYLSDPETRERVFTIAQTMAFGRRGVSLRTRDWPLPHVWQGVSVEDQQRADERLPMLRSTPANVRFVSFEPLLGPVTADLTGIHQAICGGESGAGKRVTDLAWHRSLRDQCKAQGVAFYEKQIDKVQPIPPDLRVREFPDFDGKAI